MEKERYVFLNTIDRVENFVNKIIAIVITKLNALDAKIIFIDYFAFFPYISTPFFIISIA